MRSTVVCFILFVSIDRLTPENYAPDKNISVRRPSRYWYTRATATHCDLYERSTPMTGRTERPARGWNRRIFLPKSIAVVSRQNALFSRSYFTCATICNEYGRISKAENEKRHDKKSHFRSVAFTALQPGKPKDDVNSYWLISLLSVYKNLLERLIYNRIENGYDRNVKTAVAFIDLSSAYVWRKTLLSKFLDVVPCKTLLKLLNNMRSNRFFTVYVEEEKSKTKMLNNSLLQGSV